MCQLSTPLSNNKCNPSHDHYHNPINNNGLSGNDNGLKTPLIPHYGRKSFFALQPSAFRGKMDEVVTAADATTSATSTASPDNLLPYNLPLFSAFLACALAQFLKLFTTWFKEKRWDSQRMLDSGGMPSSHSATVTALAVAIALQQGTGAPEFALAVVLACVVMYDATGVRLHAGRQAEMLNQIVCELPPEHPLSSCRPLRDSLGHTPIQVVAGAVLGFVVAYLLKESL